MHKNAQIQMGETIAVLVVFFFLIVIGLVFYVNIATTKVQESKHKNTELESINVMKRAGSLPELQCSYNNIVNEACIDRYKLDAAAAVISANPLNYFDLFGTSAITVVQIYPDAGEGPVLLYNYTPDAYSSRLNTATPISLFDPLTGAYAFGLIEIITYGK